MKSNFKDYLNPLNYKGFTIQNKSYFRVSRRMYIMYS